MEAPRVRCSKISQLTDRTQVSQFTGRGGTPAPSPECKTICSMHQTKAEARGPTRTPRGTVVIKQGSRADKALAHYLTPYSTESC